MNTSDNTSDGDKNNSRGKAKLLIKVEVDNVEIRS